MKKTLLLILALALVGCSTHFQCLTPEDCIGQTHEDYAGEWKCISEVCLWEYQEVETQDPIVANLSEQITGLVTIQKELEFDELENLEQDLLELDW